MTRAEILACSQPSPLSIPASAPQRGVCINNSHCSLTMDKTLKKNICSKEKVDICSVNYLV